MPDEIPQPTPLQRIFLGPRGLRAGWGIALFSALPVALYILSLLLMRYFPLLVQQPKGPQEMRPGVTLLSEAFAFAVFVVIAFLISFIEKRPFRRYGLDLTRALPDFATGFAWGFVMLSALVAALYFTHAIAFHGLALHGLPTLAYAFYWAAAFLFVGLLEEFLFRGYLQYTLTRGLTGIVPHGVAFWISALVFSVGLFAWTHTSNGGETAWGIFAVALAGVTFVFSLYRTGTLWWAIGFHAAWDWAQSYFYGTPDSGNLARGHLLATNPTGHPLLSGATAGPEGSVLVIPTLLLTCLIIHLTLPRRIYTSD
jgi:membrane protease YdiL (CAAX protease family)